MRIHKHHKRLFFNMLILLAVTWPYHNAVINGALLKPFDGHEATCIGSHDVPPGVTTIRTSVKQGPFSVTLFHNGGRCSDDVTKSPLAVSMGSYGGHVQLASCILNSSYTGVCSFNCNQTIFNSPSFHFLFSQWFMHNSNSTLCEIDIYQPN